MDWIISMKKEKVFFVAIIALVLSVAALLLYQNFQDNPTTKLTASIVSQETEPWQTEETPIFRSLI